MSVAVPPPDKIARTMVDDPKQANKYDVVTLFCCVVVGVSNNDEQ